MFIHGLHNPLASHGDDDRGRHEWGHSHTQTKKGKETKGKATTGNDRKGKERKGSEH
jgi:hypothetical protein